MKLQSSSDKGYVTVRCYAELNEHLPVKKRGIPFPVAFHSGLMISDLLSSIQVPPDEVDLALVNGESVELFRGLHAGDHISLYPVFESFDIASISNIRREPLRTVRFVLDVHLGKLASLLRMLGFDTLYRNDFTDEDLVTISTNSGRTLLSKDRPLAGDPRLSRAYCVRGFDPRLQLLEVMERFDLERLILPFTRCVLCNTLLSPVPEDEIHDQLPPKVRDAYHEFTRCPACSRVYWRGSHFKRMQEYIDSVLRDLNSRRL